MIRPRPVTSFQALAERVLRLISSADSKVPAAEKDQLSLFAATNPATGIQTARTSVAMLLDTLTASIPAGDVYLFGGLLRDIALYGSRGFNSDIDVVVDGRWDCCEKLLVGMGAERNKFGGYRIRVAHTPVDVWHAESTWACREGLIPYEGIRSLTRTTILNWDAILMNWRTKVFVHEANYLEDLSQRKLDIVLKENPNPLGMAVRVFRHYCSRDPRSITAKAAAYLAGATLSYSFDEIAKAEISSYRNRRISLKYYDLFRLMTELQFGGPQQRFTEACRILERSSKPPAFARSTGPSCVDS